MSKLPEIHLCLQQPAGYVHSLGLLDPARYFRYQFRRLGANVTMAKNRLRHDALNFVFGAHLGFDASLRERHACVFVNLEQLGDGGAQVSADYLKLLAGSAVVDYDADNRAAYAREADDVPVVPILHAPYLKPAQSIPLEERPIDLLFIGSMNQRRRAWLDRIEALGLSVAMFDGPMYGPERDGFIAQAKAVVNAHFYETSRFEQVRVSHCLSLGTPVLAERTEHTRAHPAFEDCVLWMQGGDLEQFFAEDFGTPMFYDVAREALARFEQADPIEAYADLLAFTAGFAGAHRERHPASVWQPPRIHLGAGASYRSGWLNIDTQDKTEPDLKLDLAAALPLPLFAHSGTAGPIELAEHSVELIRATAVPAAWADWMGNCLRLLQTGGELHVEMPIEHARAVDAQVWRDCTDGFWTLGWFEHRFDLSQFTFIDARRQECAPELATGLHVRLCKVATSMRERVDARSLQVNLRVDEDFADDVVVAASAVELPTAMPALPAAMPAQDIVPVSVPVPNALALLRRQPQTA